MFGVMIGNARIKRNHAAKRAGQSPRPACNLRAMPITPPIMQIRMDPHRTVCDVGARAPRALRRPISQCAPSGVVSIMFMMPRRRPKAKCSPWRQPAPGTTSKRMFICSIMHESVITVATSACAEGMLNQSSNQEFHPQCLHVNVSRA